MAVKEKSSGMFIGKPHSAGGIPFDIRGQHVEVEGDEMSLHRFAMNSDKTFEVEGTPEEIIHELNSHYVKNYKPDKAVNYLAGGEGIVKKSAIRDKNTRYKIKGSPRYIASCVNERYGGVNFRGGKSPCSLKEISTKEYGGEISDDDALAQLGFLLNPYLKTRKDAIASARGYINEHQFQELPPQQVLLNLYEAEGDYQPALTSWVQYKEGGVIDVIARKNEQLGGIELKFSAKPAQSVIDSLKANGWRWSKLGHWWTRYSDERWAFAQKVADGNIGESSPVGASGTSDYRAITAATVGDRAVAKNVITKEILAGKMEVAKAKRANQFDGVDHIPHENLQWQDALEWYNGSDYAKREVRDTNNHWTNANRLMSNGWISLHGGWWFLRYKGDAGTVLTPNRASLIAAMDKEGYKMTSAEFYDKYGDIVEGQNYFVQYPIGVAHKTDAHSSLVWRALKDSLYDNSGIDNNRIIQIISSVRDKQPLSMFVESMRKFIPQQQPPAAAVEPEPQPEEQQVQPSFANAIKKTAEKMGDTVTITTERDKALEDKIGASDKRSLDAEYLIFEGLGHRYPNKADLLSPPIQYDDAQKKILKNYLGKNRQQFKAEDWVYQRMWGIASALGYANGDFMLDLNSVTGRLFYSMPSGFDKKVGSLYAYSDDEVSLYITKVLNPFVTAVSVIPTTLSGATKLIMFQTPIGSFPLPKNEFVSGVRALSWSEYLFALAIKNLAHGGIVIGLTYDSILRTEATPCKMHIASVADFVDGYELPAGALKDYPQTRPNLVIFRKKTA